MNRYQLTMTRGDSRTFDFDDLHDADGIAFDLNGATVTFLVEDLMTLTATTDASAGTILVTVAPADTADAPDERHGYRYEVEVTESDGSVHTARRGILVIVPDIELV